MNGETRFVAFDSTLFLESTHTFQFQYMCTKLIGYLRMCLHLLVEKHKLIHPNIWLQTSDQPQPCTPIHPIHESFHLA